MLAWGVTALGEPCEGGSWHHRSGLVGFRRKDVCSAGCLLSSGIRGLASLGGAVCLGQRDPRYESIKSTGNTVNAGPLHGCIPRPHQISSD